MPDITRDDVVTFIENMTVLELSQFIKDLQERFGVSAAMPMALQTSTTPRSLRRMRMRARHSPENAPACRSIIPWGHSSPPAFTQRALEPSQHRPCKSPTAPRRTFRVSWSS